MPCVLATKVSGASAAPGSGSVTSVEGTPRLMDPCSGIAKIRGAGGPESFGAHADRGAARYAPIGSYGYARHIRTNLAEDSGLRRADAVYTVSPALPDGSRTIDAAAAAAACAEDGIPTI